MRKISLVFAFLLVPMTSFAAGPFDGIYSVNFNGVLGGYASIHEDDTNNMIAVLLEADPDDTTWEAMSGVRNGNNVTLQSIAGTVILDVSVSFIDSNTGTATINSCVGDCDFPNGSVLDINRTF